MFPWLLLTTTILGAEPAERSRPFALRIVDADTGRGVPLVELRTVHGIRLFTDNHGIAAFEEPGLLGQEVFFSIQSHGYEFAKDGFGFRGKSLRTTPGGEAKLTIRRINLAERLYRVTGAGLYRDSVLTGTKVPLREPLLSGQVVGCDSVLNTVYRGKIYWFWGDTNRPSYPLGNFHVPGATSELPGKSGLAPDAGIDLRYFMDEKGFARPTMKMPGKGPTWMTSLIPLADREGRERLYASYVKVEPPLKVHARGLAVFDDDRQEFARLAEVDMKSPIFPTGHALRHTEGGVDHVYFAHPFPVVRVRASAEHFRRIEEYESFTCLKEGSTTESPLLDRDEKGKLRYAWRKNTPALGPQEEAKLLRAGTIKDSERRWRLHDRDTGKAVIPHSGSVYWNEYRKRWVMIFVEIGGTSLLGEVWYAEADSLPGPWAHAVKVVTHDRYSFYNPKQHPMFDQEGGRLIYFEGTYTHTFSGNMDATPRYDYNQVLYRLDLGGSALGLPIPIYDAGTDPGVVRFETGRRLPGRAARIAFFAPDRPLPGTLPVLSEKNRLILGNAGSSGAVFHALPPDVKQRPSTAVPLYEHRQKNGPGRVYSVAETVAGHERQQKPLCLVWRGPEGE